MDEQAYTRFHECSFKVWDVDAEERENGSNDLIIQERGWEAFEDRRRGLRQSRSSRRRRSRSGSSSPRPDHALNRQGPSAAASSELTDSSDSTDALDDMAALASAVPTRPSAQTACPRTSGSGSASPAVSTGTASGDAQLPSPTHTLRAHPARPARRNADPLENESHAASSSAVSSSAMSDGEAVPACDLDAPGASCTPNGGSPGARAANPGSGAGFEKRLVNGHTSWEECRLPRYVIRLPRGRRK
jgi:hypothetical protein